MTRLSLYDKVYNYLYEEIITQNIKPGQAIVEQEISGLLGVSRTPVREVLKKLETEGLVKHYSSRGTFVKEVTTQDIEEIFELRSIFEEMALRSAIHKIPDEELEELESLLNSLEFGVNTAEEFYETDRSLHRVIISYSKNQRMADFLKTINSQAEMLRRISAMTPKRLQKSKQEHLEIIGAIKERDIEKAVNSLHTHLDNVKNSTLDICMKVYYK